MYPHWIALADPLGFLMTQDFWEAVASSFLGGVLAGITIAVGVYLFVTRRLQVLKPVAERRAEQRVICSVISRELGQFRYSANTLFKEGRFSGGANRDPCMGSPERFSVTAFLACETSRTNSQCLLRNLFCESSD